MNRPRIRSVTFGGVAPSGESVGAGSTTLLYEEDPIVIQDRVPAPIDQVWAALLLVHREMGLPPDGMDAEARLLSLERGRLVESWNRTDLTLLFDCGLATSGLPLVRDAEVSVMLFSQLEEVQEGTRVSVRLEAYARPFSASGGRAQSCVTTGRLEEDLLARVRQRSIKENSDSSVIVESVSSESREPGLPGTPGGLMSPAAPNPSASALGQTELTLGDWVRIRGPGSRQLTGTFLGLRADSLLIRRSRTSIVSLETVNALEVQRARRGYTIGGAILGAAVGVTLAVTTDLGITGRHQIQGKILNPGLGAIAGGLLGGFLSHSLLGTYWERIPLNRRK